MPQTDPQPQSLSPCRTIVRRILPLVLGLAFSFFASAASAASLPDSACAPSTQLCGHLGNLPYPFGKNGSHCGASPKFQLSNCSQSPTSVYWDNFYGRPAVLHINASIPSSLTITWTNSIPPPQPCQIHLAEQIPLFLPNSSPNVSGINLRYSTDFSAFSLSPKNIFLLFNCTNLAHVNSSNYLEPNSKSCTFFKSQCPRIPNDLCVQFQPQWKLDLATAMTGSNCSHFQFLLTENPSLPLDRWTPHAVQLEWAPQDFNFQSGMSCKACEDSNGTCGYDGDTKFRCCCSNNQFSEEDCTHLTGKGKRIKKTVIILGVLAGALAALFVSFTSWCCMRGKRRIFSGTSTCSSSNSDKKCSQTARLLSCRLNGICAQEYSYHDVLEATLSFADDNIIGDGGFGSVYLGRLKDGCLIAVKKLFQDASSRKNVFYNEIQILSGLKHPNLVKFYGFCCEDERNLLLVFEYLANGSVFDQLHYEDAIMKGASPVGIPSWRVRLRLAMETAEALSYLHNSVNPPVVHRDVKTTNILLDENFHAKLADFGLSKLVPLEVTHVSTALQGTPGYLDPEYQCCYRLTDKSDVYSFGVVLMELVSGEKAVDFSRREEEINLSSMALSRNQRGSWKELVDTRSWQIETDTDAGVVVGEMVQLAFWCLQPERCNRPSMSDVLATLTGLCQRYSCLRSCESANGS